MEKLRWKGWQIQDLNKNPVCLGVPVGHPGMDENKAVEVDIGLKTFVSVGLTDLIDASPDLKEELMMRALDGPPPEAGAPSPHLELLRHAKPVPMSVMVKEDMMKQPVGVPVHPAALERCVPDEKLDLLQDPFFRATPPSSELVELVVDAVPGADKHVSAREDFRRDQRAMLHNERMTQAGRQNNRGGK